MTPKQSPVHRIVAGTLIVVASHAQAGAVNNLRPVPALGGVHFQTTCNPAVQPAFDYATALLHSFEFSESAREFRKIEKQDPTCSVAAWGVAMSMLERRGADMPQATLSAGWEELKPWLVTPAGSAREQMYLKAVSLMYRGFENTPASVRWARYVNETAIIHRTYPADINASLFYALALIWTAGSGPPGISHRRQALNILLPIFHAHPDNPGAAHYIIHAADVPDLAQIALPAARHYALIAPASPHALHMPSHIFSRMGLWDESIRSNIASVKAAELWTKEGKEARFDEAHALNALEYAYLQVGDDKSASETIAQISHVMAGKGGDSWAEVDAKIYYDLERDDWQDALRIEAPSDASFADSFDIYWIQAISLSQLNRSNDAEVALARFRDSSRTFSQEHGWGDTFEFEQMEAEGWLFFSTGERQKAIRMMTAAVAYEKAHPIYYSDVLARPAAEMLGNMYLLVDKPKPALTAYQTSLRLAPNRLDSLIGAYRAAIRGDEMSEAHRYALRVDRLCSPTANRPEVAAIRDWLRHDG